MKVQILKPLLGNKDLEPEEKEESDLKQNNFFLEREIEELKKSGKF
ncbi:MAG: hypothetical protein N2Z80_02345 [Hydrogenothermaceae bacterium]|nr:hypothetical protein [Hydrogenothermaceae bacterium]